MQKEYSEYTVASVTVVYNGARVLPRQLNALQRQTRKLDEIVVVDNASSDNTAALLAKEYPEVTVLNLPENGGVGGGFAAGLSYATFKKKYDWVWLFDQDSVPASHGLELLLRGLQELNNSSASTAILAPICMDPATGMICPGHMWREGRFVPAPLNPSRSVSLVDAVISSGSLIRGHAVNVVGLPRADFFMDFVDYEHCLRLRRQGFKIAMVHDSRVDHVLGNPSKFNVLGRTKYWTDHVPWREYYMTRNEIFTVWLYYPQWKTKGWALYRLFRHALVVLLFGKHKMACFRMIWHGFRDGCAGRLGKRFSETSSA